MKEVRMNEQDAYEKVAKDLKPLTEKFHKEIKEISKLREDVTKQVAPYAQKVQRLAQAQAQAQVVRHQKW